MVTTPSTFPRERSTRLPHLFVSGFWLFIVLVRRLTCPYLQDEGMVEISWSWA